MVGIRLKMHGMVRKKHCVEAVKKAINTTIGETLSRSRVAIERSSPHSRDHIIGKPKCSLIMSGKVTESNPAYSFNAV